MAVKNDASTGQLMVGGMGELHLEVLLQRLASEWQLRVRARARSIEVTRGHPRSAESRLLRVHAGEMRVAYRESICSAVRRTSTHASQLKEGGEVRIEIEVEP